MVPSLQTKLAVYRSRAAGGLITCFEFSEKSAVDFSGHKCGLGANAFTDLTEELIIWGSSVLYLYNDTSYWCDFYCSTAAGRSTSRDSVNLE